MPRLVRPLAFALVLAACGDPVAPGTAGDDLSGTTAAADPTTGATAPATTTGATPNGTMGHGESASTGTLACDPAALTLAERGFVARDDSVTDAELAACGEDRWYVALPSESSWELRLTKKSGPGTVQAVVAYPDEPPEAVWQAALAPPLASGQAPAQAIFAVPRSGEFALHVRSDMPEQPAAYDLELRCVLGCERETTRFPLVLVHGWTGFEAIGPITYFFGIKLALEELGYPIEIAVLDPYNHTLIRSGQLGEQIDDFLLLERARKVDLIGHSQGGVDSRAVVSTHGYGDRVSVVVTVASPHRGTYITDLALGLAPGPVEDALGFLLNLVGAVTAQQKSDAIASFHSLSETYMQGEFNPNNPDDPRVEYISYTGRTCDALGFLDPDKDCLDLVHPLIGWSYTLLDATRGDNDGLVTVDSARWGDYRGEMIADHLNEVGQLAGITDPKFDHYDWYQRLARDLAAEAH